MNHSKFIIGDIPIYYINLESSKDRNQRLLMTFRNHKITNFKRVNAIGVTKNDSEQINVIDPYINKKMLSCKLSHIKAIEQAYNDNQKYVLIMEDDCNFDYLKYKTKPIVELMNEIKDCEILQLALCCREDNNLKVKNMQTEFMKGSLSCTTAYLINRNGMEKVISSSKLKPLKEADYFIYENANTYICKPYFTYYYSSQKPTIYVNSTYNLKDTSKKFWDEYYLRSKKHKAILLILDSDNLSSYAYNREVYKSYMNNHPEFLAFFIKYNENIKDNVYLSLDDMTIYIKGSEIFSGESIFNKTKVAAKFIYENYKFDYLLRTNISSFWIYDNLIKYLNGKKSDHIFGIMYNIDNESSKFYFISGTGIFIPYDFIPHLINHNFYKLNDDDTEISYIYRENGILLRDSRRQNSSFIFKFEEKSIENINEKIKKIPDNVVYFRVKNENRDYFDKYVLNYLLSKYYEISIQN